MRRAHKNPTTLLTTSICQRTGQSTPIANAMNRGALALDESTPTCAQAFPASEWRQRNVGARARGHVWNLMVNDSSGIPLRPRKVTRRIEWGRTRFATACPRIGPQSRHAADPASGTGQIRLRDHRRCLRLASARHGSASLLRHSMASALATRSRAGEPRRLCWRGQPHVDPKSFSVRGALSKKFTPDRCDAAQY